MASELTQNQPGRAAAASAHDPWLAGARKLARVMDHHHLDPIMGLVLPGLGDVVGGILGLFIIGVAVKRDVPRLTLARMLLNVAIAVVVGAIPLLGDAFDFYFRASTRNLALLERPGRPSRNAWVDGAILALAVLLMLAALCAPVVLVVYLIMRYRQGY